MKIPFAHQTILILAPHTDDAELGCGGTMARLFEEGKKVHVAAFSSAKESLTEDSPSNRLVAEFHTSMQKLGIPSERIHLYDYPVRNLNLHRQELLDQLILLRKQLLPDLVLLPSQHDLHQDHQVIAYEGLRAFKEASVWGYELPWNTLHFSSQALVELDPIHLQSKWSALQAYQSQLELARPYFTWEFIESLARVRGMQNNTLYAEAFEVHRIRF